MNVGALLRAREKKDHIQEWCGGVEEIVFLNFITFKEGAI